MIYTGKIVYDPLTDTYSTGYWLKDSHGYWYPVWNSEDVKNERKTKSKKIQAYV